LLVYAFYGAELLGQDVHGQVHFAKGSFTEDFTDSVEVNGGVWSRLMLAEAQFYQFYQFSNLS